MCAISFLFPSLNVSLSATGSLGWRIQRRFSDAWKLIGNLNPLMEAKCHLWSVVLSCDVPSEILSNSRTILAPHPGEAQLAHIQLPIAPELGREFPGIVGPMTFRPETAAPINELVNILLRGESALTRGERELIATHVSWRNDCFFCQTIHGAVAAAQMGNDEQLVQRVKTDWESTDISPKLKALLNIAGKAQLGGKHVTAEDVLAARQQGATDLEIHDTVLIAAVFCMANRYVDGLGTWAPSDPAIYRERAVEIVEHGYTAVTEAATVMVQR
jgi:uncharacterized peroxidase-related enzyme